MKIEIEFDNSYEAKLTIGGRELTVDIRPGVIRLEGIKLPESEETFGGMVANELFGTVGEIVKAWATVIEMNPGAGTWDVLDETTVDEVYQILS